MTHLPKALAIALLLAAGGAHGYLTDRWGPSRELEEAVVRIPRIPLALGDWRGEDVEPDETRRTQLERAQSVSTLMRRYRDRRTGEAVSVLLVSGRPGPISTHTPEICYGNVGYALSAPARRFEAPGAPGSEPGEFWYGDFRKSASVAPSYLRIFWSWGTRDGWKAVDNPRLAFAASRALYKLYVVRETAAPEAPDQGETSVRFLREFLPALDRALFDHGTGA